MPSLSALTSITAMAEFHHLPVEICTGPKQHWHAHADDIVAMAAELQIWQLANYCQMAFETYGDALGSLWMRWNILNLSMGPMIEVQLLVNGESFNLEQHELGEKDAKALNAIDEMRALNELCQVLSQTNTHALLPHTGRFQSVFGAPLQSTQDCEQALARVYPALRTAADAMLLDAQSLKVAAQPRARF